MLAAIAGTLRDDYVKTGEADPWSDSPFKWIKTRPSRQVGKIGEQLVAGWCAAKGFDVTKSGDSEADRVIAGKRVEIKFSTLWKSGVFKFQQLRDQDYEYAICLGRQGVTRSGCLSEPRHRLVGLTNAVAVSPTFMESLALGSAGATVVSKAPRQPLLQRLKPHRTKPRTGTHDGGFDSRQLVTFFPQSGDGRVRLRRTARMADRAALIELTWFLALIRRVGGLRYQQPDEAQLRQAIRSRRRLRG